MPARIFISHSHTKTEVEGEVFDKLLDRLHDKGFPRDGSEGARGSLLIDANILGGDLWRKRLFEWLLQADHGIIFCTPLSGGAGHLAEMRDWLYVEAVVLAFRHHVEVLGKLMIVCCGVKFADHPLATLDAIQLKELQNVKILDADDIGQLDEVVDQLANAATPKQPDRSELVTKLVGDHDILLNWLAGFNRNSDDRKRRLEAMQKLCMAFPHWLGDSEEHVSLKDSWALALRLIQGPLSPPDVYSSDTLGPYWQRHVYGWDRLLGCRNSNPLQPNMMDKISTTWVTVETANRLGHEIHMGTRAFHIRIAPGATNNRPITAKKLWERRRFLLESFVSAGGWIWRGDRENLHIELVAEAFRFFREAPATWNTVLNVDRSMVSVEDLIDAINTKKDNPDRPPQFTPIIVVDECDFFIDHGELDAEKIQKFIGESHTKSAIGKKCAESEVVLFIVSIGPPSSVPLPENLVEFEISEEAWQAAFGLRSPIVQPPNSLPMRGHDGQQDQHAW